MQEISTRSPGLKAVTAAHTSRHATPSCPRTAPAVLVGTHLRMCSRCTQIVVLSISPRHLGRLDGGLGAFLEGFIAGAGHTPARRMSPNRPFDSNHEWSLRLIYRKAAVSWRASASLGGRLSSEIGPPTSSGQTETGADAGAARTAQMASGALAWGGCGTQHQFAPDIIRGRSPPRCR